MTNVQFFSNLLKLKYLCIEIVLSLLIISFLGNGFFFGVVVIIYEVSFDFIFMNSLELFLKKEWVVIYTQKNHVNCFSIF